MIYKIKNEKQVINIYVGNSEEMSVACRVN